MLVLASQNASANEGSESAWAEVAAASEVIDAPEVSDEPAADATVLGI